MKTCNKIPDVAPVRKKLDLILRRAIDVAPRIPILQIIYSVLNLISYVLTDQ